MQCDQTVVGDIRTAIQVKSYIQDGDALRDDALEAAMGISSVIASDGLKPGHAGVSWPDAEGRSNALLVTDGQLIHAIVAGDAVEATNYTSPIDTLKAAEFEKHGQFVADGWRIMKWHVTLRDGAVLTLRGANGQHSDEVATFVRAHLLPVATD